MVTLGNQAIRSLNFLYSNRHADTPSLPASQAQSRLLCFIFASVHSFLTTASCSLKSGSSDQPSMNHLIWFTYLKFVCSVSPSPSRQPVGIPFPFSHSLPQFPDYSSPAYAIPPYFPQPPNVSVQVRPLIASKVALPSLSSGVNLLSLLPDHLAQVYSSPQRLLREFSVSPSERAPLVESLGAQAALFPPRIGGPHPEYLALVRRMSNLDMVGFTAKPKVVCSVFTVDKPIDDLRLIIDARPAAPYFLDPPHVQLPNPSHLTRLHTSSDEDLWVAKCDLESFYHQLIIPEWLQQYLALPRVLVSDLVALGIEVPAAFRGLKWIHPTCSRLPMGWSHSVFLGQAVHEHVLYGSVPLSVPRPLYPHRGSIFEPLDPRCNGLSCQFSSQVAVIHLIIIDDIVLISHSRKECLFELLRCLQRYAHFGLAVGWRKLYLPTNLTQEVLGQLVNGMNKRISLPHDKLFRLIHKTLAALQFDTISGEQVSSLLGDWVWLLLLRRPALAVFHSAYRFARVARTRQFSMWPSVRQEFETVLSLLPLLNCDTSAVWSERVYATDASSTGGGVCSSTLPDDMLSVLCSRSGTKQLVYQSIVSEQQSQLGKQPASPTPATLQPYNSLLSDSSFSSDSARTVASRPAVRLIHSLPPWKTLISSPWSWEQHINTLELHAVHLALRHFLSTPHSVGKRLFILLDSAVITYAITKGRSSAKTLVPGMRRLAALLLSSGVQLWPAWIPTDINPADRPSRRFEHAKNV